MNEGNSLVISGAKPELDLGGGGDQTFHQVTNMEIDNHFGHQEDEINSNYKERMIEGDGVSVTNEDDAEEQDERTESAEEMEDAASQDEAGVEDVKTESKENMLSVSQNEDETVPNTDRLETERRESADGKEETEEDAPADDENKETSQEDKEEQEDVQIEDFGDPRKLDRQQRNNVYNQACTFEQEGKADKALMYFLAAITGLTENNSFHDLPQCLHQVSNIYFEKKEYEKAVHFIQAEKMYYETALLDIVNLQKHLAQKHIQKQAEGDESSTPREDADESSKDESVTESKDTIPEITKAREFENLARLCLKEGKPQLALEYCGKATKIYRSELGDDHPVTVGSLDLFAIIYADVGKNLYEDAMKKFGVDEEREETEDSKTPESQQDSSSSSSILGKRSKLERKTLGKKSQSAPQLQVHFEEYEPSPPAAETDDWVTTVLLMILFFLITILFALIFSYFYCQNNDRSDMCAELKGDLTYWYMKLQYTYKYYTGSGRR